MEQLPDIRNVLTPLSLGTNGSHRALWKQSTGRFASTPRHRSELQPLRPTFKLDQNHLDESLAESPILPARSKLRNGRKQSLESDRLSISTSVLTTLGRMELCDNNNDSAQEYLQKKITNTMKKNDEGESSSSIDAQEKFKKQLNKNKKNKGISPKKKSPKVYKIVLKKFGPEVATKKSASSTKAASSVANAKKKSPKNKSPKTYKICPTKKVVSSSSAAKPSKNPTKDGHDAGSSNVHSENKSLHHETKHSELKMLQCAKSPKLRTAERALIKQYRSEMRKEKEKFYEKQKQKELEEQRRRDEEKMLKLRQQTLFKAHAIRKYAPLPNLKKRALTDPISPNFSKRRRIESSSQNSNNHASHNKT
ncbi:putative uncharacterized protein DDB_G0271982 [Phymastichus coffea]|uniref:putative uncharacterized protein DDB_G0271982 n=1 Tax=Phymastichus coffea TaxID=108790 RepID=UPI00273B88C3|nr:putative uncharacterized protein DDB_G0271982 [Phymastichus coffea]